MKRALLFTFTLFVIASLFGCASSKTPPQEEKQKKENSQQTIESDKEVVKHLIKNFGSKLQNVPLQAQKDILNTAALVPPIAATRIAGHTR